MGGSSLAPEVFRRSYGDAEGALRLHVLDSTEPLPVAAVADAIDLAKTLFIVSSKSGGTIETLSLFKHFRGLQPDGRALRRDHRPGLLAAPTWPRSTASGARSSTTPRSAGATRRCRTSGSSRPRWPASTSGRARGRAGRRAELPDFERPRTTRASGSALALGELARAGRDKLTFVVDPPLSSFGIWAEQLVAESTGKQGRGILPIADEPLRRRRRLRAGPRVPAPARRRRARRRHDESIAALAAAGHPTITSTPTAPTTSGACSSSSEFATAVAGWVLEINPFDQPNVQEAKDNDAEGARAGRARARGRRRSRALLDGPRAAAATWRSWATCPTATRSTPRSRGCARRLIERHGVATTYGYGPRFLHSTGQFHKGGPPVGRFLQLVHDADADADDPGRAVRRSAR